MKKKIGYHNIVLLNRTMSMSFFFLSTFVFVGQRFGESKDHHKSDSIDGIVFDVTVSTRIHSQNKNTKLLNCVLSTKKSILTNRKKSEGKKIQKNGMTREK